MSEPSHIESLKDASIVFGAVFTSIFITISLIWILKYFFCNYDKDFNDRRTTSSTNEFDITHFGNYRYGYDPTIVYGIHGSDEMARDRTNINNASSRPIVPTKFRLLFLEKALQHEIFHPTKTQKKLDDDIDDVEKGVPIPIGDTTTTISTNNKATANDNSAADEPHNDRPSSVIVTDKNNSIDVSDNTIHKPDVDDHGETSVRQQQQQQQQSSSQSQCNTMIPSNCMNDDSIHTTPSKDIGDNNNNSYCAICYEELYDGDEITTSNCNKTFHRSCIIEWLMQHDTCPYCRNAFKNINDVPFNTNDDDDMDENNYINNSTDGSNNIDCE